MELKPIEITIEKFPKAIQAFMKNSKTYDSSCSELARVIYSDNGCFIKISPKDTLKREAVETEYMNSLGLSPKVLTYLSDDQDYLVTEKLQGSDCLDFKYLENPKKLCDTLAQTLKMLHSTDYSNCPIQNHTDKYLKLVKQNYISGNYDKTNFPDSFGYASAEEAYKVVIDNSHLLESNTLLHGDYCLPNIILNDWNFSGFIDVGNGGVGDKHVDLFWGLWTLQYNLKTDQYFNRFIDAYGRNSIDLDMLKLVAACEVFG